MRPKLSRYVVITCGSLALGLWLIVPLYWIVVSAITPSEMLLQSPVRYFPRNPTIQSVRDLAHQVPLANYISHSAIYAVSSSLLSVGFGFLAAFAVARYTFFGRSIFLTLLLLSMAVPQIGTVIPLFQLFVSLNLVNTMYGLVLITISMLLPFTVWILMTFIRKIPKELEEAAATDGAGMLRVLWTIVIPLTRPALLTMLLINFVLTWNELFFPLVFGSSQSVRPLSVALLLVGEPSGAGGDTVGGIPWSILSMLSVIMIVPVLLLTVIFQRSFVSGLTQGAVRG